MRKLFTLAALALVLATPSFAQAFGWTKPVDQYGFRQKHAPRAAPWYLYWPYDAYFNMPAPTGAVPAAPSHMSPGNFPQMYQGGFAPYPTNGYGQ